MTLGSIDRLGSQRSVKYLGNFKVAVAIGRTTAPLNIQYDG